MDMTYDLIVVGAGSAGLTAAGFAVRLGAKVALVEKHRIGGDCTWTGCVPSKALLKAAKVAHDVRTAGLYGITAAPPVTDMAKVRQYVRAAIQSVYQWERPEDLQSQGIDIVLGEAKFLNASSIVVNGRELNARHILLTTGAKPLIPGVAGLRDVPYLTYEQIFDVDRLPRTLVVMGGGPIGLEIAQAYQRLGSSVTVIAERILPKEEPETAETLERVLQREGVRFVRGKATSARRDGDAIVVGTADEEARGELLLVATGRAPSVEGLDLEKAGVQVKAKGIPVDDHLRTNVKNIYAAGDVTGGFQFTHFAGWQAFQAIRNALLPGSSSGFSDLVPWVTFTDPEVAHVGMTEAQAREQFGDAVTVCRREMSRVDRAVCENDTGGFIKLVVKHDGTLAGATIVGARAGEAITEIVVAMKHSMKLTDLAGAIHAYPTYSTPIQQMAADLAIEHLLSGTTGKILLGVSKMIR